MQFDQFRVLMRLLMPISIALLLQGCVGTPHIVTTRIACSALIPGEWKKPIEGAPLPSKDAAMGDWVGFAFAQTGQLDKANGRTADTIGIIERCEARDAKTPRRKVLGVF